MLTTQQRKQPGIRRRKKTTKKQTSVRNKNQKTKYSEKDTAKPISTKASAKPTLKNYSAKPTLKSYSAEPTSKKFNYKDAGVDVEAGDSLVDWLVSSGSQSRQPHQEKIVDGIGGFASLFRVDFSKYKKPCLVTCTDGVGTKVKLASYFKDYSGVGQDLVAMCVNDLICTGGEPLLFLDYYATGKLDQEAAREFLDSVRRACHESHCALVGGETAEMPGVYQGNDFDCAGFAVGVVDEEKSLGAHRVQTGDVLIGVASSGFHSNGYSLIRKVFAKDLKKFQKQLLEPTALYVKLSQSLRQEVDIHAFAHITGGGIENIPRVLPETLQWNRKDWEWPEMFQLVQKRTGMTHLEMLTTLNCGIGLVCVLPASEAKAAKRIIAEHGFKYFEIGDITAKASQDVEQPKNNEDKTNMKKSPRGRGA